MNPIVVVVTNIPRPYRRALFGALKSQLASQDLTLRVLYTSDPAKHVRRGAGAIGLSDPKDEVYDNLRVLLMNGIVGLMAYFGLLIVVLRSLARAVKRLAVRRGIEWRIGVAVQCLLAAYILMGVTADPSSYPSLTLYLWLLVGLVLGYANLEPEQADP
jgi:hypothetical protein